MSPNRHPGQRLPLQGYRVLDFTWIVAGPLCTKWLASQGAEVIKIESERTRRDVGRQGSPLFANNNTDKLSLCVDMGRPEAQHLVRRLAAISDVVIENFTPDILPRWGLSYEALREINPQIIVADMPAMGSTGPRRHYKGLGHYFSGLAGLDDLTGYPGRDPIDVLGWAFSDTGPNPFHMLVGLLSALHHRRRTGEGQRIELRQYESIVNFMGTVVMDYAVNGHQQTRMGSRSEFAAPYGVYRCLGDDRWCVITVESHEDWAALCRTLGHAEWLGDDRFATFAARKTNEDHLDLLLEQWTVTRSPEEVMGILQGAGVASGVVQHAGDLMAGDPQLAARGFYVPLQHADAAPMLHEGLTFKLSGTTGGVSRPAPILGEHNDYVLQGLLGLAEDEVNQLITSGVVM